MAEIIPFRAVRYDKKNISDFICPPYDIISLPEKKLYLKKNLCNAIKIELPKNYHSAKKNFDLWLSKKVLIRDLSPSFYFYEQRFKFKGKKYNRCGFFALLKTEKFGKNIFPHEKTHTAPKLDRLNLLKATGINTSPIFCLFSDKKEIFRKIVLKIKKEKPLTFAYLPNGKEKMWKISDKKTIKVLKNLLKNNKILIADGHHRYETFYQFTKVGCILTFLCPFEDEGLLILPTHRLVKNWTDKDTKELAKFFEFDKKWDFKLCIKNKFFYLKVPRKFKYLPIQYLHSTILKNKELEYTKDEQEAIKKISAGEFPAAVIVKAVSIEELKLVVKRKICLPQKSTYFYPKVSTGFVFNEISLGNKFL